MLLVYHWRRLACNLVLEIAKIATETYFKLVKPLIKPNQPCFLFLFLSELIVLCFPSSATELYYHMTRVNNLRVRENSSPPLGAGSQLQYSQPLTKPRPGQEKRRIKTKKGLVSIGEFEMASERHTVSVNSVASSRRECDAAPAAAPNRLKQSNEGSSYPK
jgi:hypothetical protein